MKKMLKIVKWTAITVVAAFVMAAAYVGLNSFDCEPPDISRFVNPMEVPADADNVYCALVAATNVVTATNASVSATHPALVGYHADWIGNPNAWRSEVAAIAVIVAA